MTKTDFPTWMKFSLAVLAILAIGVGWGVGYKALADNVGHNTDGLETINVKVDKTIEDVHRIELDAKDIKNVAVQAAKSMASVDARLESIQKEQAKQATIQAVNSEKLKSLTKD